MIKVTLDNIGDEYHLKFPVRVEASGAGDYRGVVVRCSNTAILPMVIEQMKLTLAEDVGVSVNELIVDDQRTKVLDTLNT